MKDPKVANHLGLGKPVFAHFLLVSLLEWRQVRGVRGLGELAHDKPILYSVQAF